MMADEFNLLWSEMQNYIAEADADLINTDMVSCCLHTLVLYLLQIELLGWGNLELKCRCRADLISEQLE